MKQKLQTAAIIVLIMLMPFMWYIEVGGTTVNFSLADLVLPFIGVLILINIKELFKQKKWLVILYFVGLLFSIALSQFTSRYNTEFLHTSDHIMLLEMVKTIVVAVYFIGALLLIDQNNFKICLITMSLGSIPVIIIGLSSYIYFILEKPFPFASYALSDTLRFKGTFEDPNLCALYFIIVFFICLLSYRTIQNLFLRLTFVVITLCSLFIIIITMSRGGWLALFGSVVIFILFNIKRTRKESFLFILAIILFALAIANVDFWFQKGRIINDIIDRTQQTLLMDRSDVDRIQLIKAAYQMGNDNFLTGVGKGSFSLNSNIYLGNDSRLYKEQYIPHNTILGFYAQQGIVGVLLFLLLPGFLLVKLFKSIKQNKAFFIGIFSGLFFHSLTINIENVRFVWFILGTMLVTELKAIEIELPPKPKMKKWSFITVLVGMLCACFFLYFSVAVKIAANIYVSSGNSYEKQFSQIEPGDYILTFDIQTDNNLHSLKLYNSDTLIRQFDFQAAYGFVQEPIIITEGTRLVFKSNPAGWMKVNNAHIYRDGEKYPIYNYPLLIDSLQNQFSKKGLLTYREEPTFKEEIDATGSQLKAININNAHILRYSNLTHVFAFDYDCKEPVGIDYKLDLLLEYPSLSFLLPTESKRNIINYRFTLSPDTTTWEVGKKYTVKSYRLLHSETFNLFGRYFDYQSKRFEQEAFFPIPFEVVYQNQQLLSLGESSWINVRYNKDTDNIIHITNNGWVETGRINLEPGMHTLTFSAQGVWLEGYPELRLRDSRLNEIIQITLDSKMKDYTVEYHTDIPLEGVSFILELINYKSEKDVGNRKVLLKDTLTIE